LLPFGNQESEEYSSSDEDEVDTGIHYHDEMMRTNVFQHQSPQEDLKVGELYDDFVPMDQKGNKKTNTKRSITGHLKRHSRQLSEDKERLITNMQVQQQTEVEITVRYHQLNRIRKYCTMEESHPERWTP